MSQLLISWFVWPRNSKRVLSIKAQTRVGGLVLVVLYLGNNNERA